MWQTHITVAAVIEKDHKFLLVTDQTQSGPKLNQPAGHIEANEDIVTAVIREVKEETSLDFIPKNIIGIYLYHPNPEHTYLRVCFKGELADPDATPKPRSDDDGVIEANWYSLAEIYAKSNDLRSQLVIKCIDDYLAGLEYPLSIIADYRDSSPQNII